MSFLSDLFSFRRGQPDEAAQLPAEAPATEATGPAADQPASPPTAPTAAEAEPPATASAPDLTAGSTAASVPAPPAAVEPAAPDPSPAPTPAAPAGPTPELRAQADKLVRAVRQELPDFITVAVVEIGSGQILAGQWAGHSGGAVEAAAANAELVRHLHLALEAQQLAPAEQLQDIVVTLRRQQHLLQLLPRQQWLLYLAVSTPGTNLALARTVLRSFAD